MNVFTLNATSLTLLFFYQLKCRSTLRISGLVPSAYWCGQAAIDVPFYYLILICMTSTLFAFHSTNLLTSHNIMSVVRKRFHQTFFKTIILFKLFKLKEQSRCQHQHISATVFTPFSGSVSYWLRSSHGTLHILHILHVRQSPEQQGLLLSGLHDGESSRNFPTNFK